MANQPHPLGYSRRFHRRLPLPYPKRTCSRLGTENPFLGNTGIHVVLTGVRMPLMNSLTERWVQTCRHELLDRTLIWNERHLRHALRDLPPARTRPHLRLRETESAGRDESQPALCDNPWATSQCPRGDLNPHAR
ncbi:hypothetical protein BOG92_018070 [Streptomyces sp. WAC00263]|nr:hypothetical protein BOG92_018070 [Streptomyces sp. WAC00263]